MLKEVNRSIAITQHLNFKRNIEDCLRHLTAIVNYNYYDITVYQFFLDNTKENNVRRGQKNQNDSTRESLIRQQPT